MGSSGCGLRGGLRAAAVALFAILGAPGCGNEALTLRVDLRTDLRPEADFDTARARIVAAPDEGSLGSLVESPADASADYLIGVRLGELTGLVPGRYTVEVALHRDSATVGSRTIELELSETTTVNAVITASCASLMCPAVGDPPDATECVGGRCVSPTCTPETPEACPPQCTADADCPIEGDCLGGRCVEGDCFQSPDDALCATGSTCADTGVCRAPTAMRITSLTLRDPHILRIMCSFDATGSLNDLLQTAIGGGDLDIVGLWRPLDPAEPINPFELHSQASCTAAAGCMPAGEVVTTDAANQSTGACFAADADTLGYPDTPPNEPTGSCFVTEPRPILLTLDSVELPLEDAVLAGQYADGRIESGVIAGFLTYEAAMTTRVPGPFTTDMVLYDSLRGGACNGNDDDPRVAGGADAGWWFYLDFEADAVTWSE